MIIWYNGKWTNKDEYGMYKYTNYIKIIHILSSTTNNNNRKWNDISGYISCESDIIFNNNTKKNLNIK